MSALGVGPPLGAVGQKPSVEVPSNLNSQALAHRRSMADFRRASCPWHCLHPARSGQFWPAALESWRSAKLSRRGAIFWTMSLA